MGHREFLGVSPVYLAGVRRRRKVRVIDVAFVVVQHRAKTMTTALDVIPLHTSVRTKGEQVRNF